MLEKYEKKYDVSEERKDLKENYYAKELSKLLPIDEYGVRIQLSSSNGQTKWIALNRESIKELNDFLNNIVLG